MPNNILMALNYKFMNQDMLNSSKIPINIAANDLISETIEKHCEEKVTEVRKQYLIQNSDEVVK